MERSTESIGAIIARRGIIEVFYQTLSVSLRRARSFCQIIILRMRGYDIPFTVEFSGANRFFQSTLHAIKVGNNTRFGYSTRIDAGFEGNISIGANTLIDDYCFITAQSSIVIGKNVLIAASCMITDFNHRYTDRNLPITAQGYEQKKVVIDDNVWIGSGSIVLAGVHIGKGSVIGAGSVVTRDVPPNSVVAGNPAVPIRRKT
jgi:acetyltransferase-like isoleucine patch superfamily enzyme